MHSVLNTKLKYLPTSITLRKKIQGCPLCDEDDTTPVAQHKEMKVFCSPYFYSNST